jgi:light-regulated signal transduction histidine kinase (bacteriophytochrome)
MTGTILIVDGVAPSRGDEIAERLCGADYDVIRARSGEDAFDVLSVRHVDCALIGAALPGMDGEEACRRIKETPGLRDVPLILLGERDDPAAAVRGLDAGADDVFPLSGDWQLLEARIRSQLRRHRSEAERAALRVADAERALARDLDRKNKEIAALTHSVSHDLRAPLRSIRGFGRILLEDCADKLDAEDRDHLERVCGAAEQMGDLLEGLVELSRVNTADLHFDMLDLSSIARSSSSHLRAREPGRGVDLTIHENLRARADARLTRMLFDNLLANAWKFTARIAAPRVAVGAEERQDEVVYFVRDNGAGFDMARAHHLFAPFKRLHGSEFPGLGIGLAAAYRVVDRHGGRMWAEGAVDAGATFFFTLRPSR